MIGLSELRAQGWKYGCLAALAGLLAVSGFAGVQSFRLVVAKGATAILASQYAQADKARAEAQTRASEAARAEEQARARAMESAAKAYERGKTDAKAAGERVADELRAGAVRLREQWRGCEARGLPSAAAASGHADELAELRNADTGRLAGIGDAADAWVRGLQAACQVGRDDGQHASRLGN